MNDPEDLLARTLRDAAERAPEFVGIQYPQKPRRQGLLRSRPVAIAASAAAVAAVTVGIWSIGPLGSGPQPPVTPPTGGPSSALCPRAGQVDSGPGSGQDVVYVAPDCSQTPLATSPLDEHSPAVASDGRTVAYFVTSTDGGTTLHVDGPGSTGRSYPVDGPAGSLAWSPNSGSVAYWRDDGSGHPEVYTLDLSTGTERRLTSNEFVDSQPQWSPDGSALAVTRTVSGGSEIVLVDLSSGAEQVLRPDEHGVYSYPAWADDGASVAAVETGPQGDRVVEVSVASGEVTLRSRTLDGDVVALDWTGSRLLVATAGDSLNEAVLSELDASTMSVLGTEESVTGVPAWPATSG